VPEQNFRDIFPGSPNILAMQIPSIFELGK